MMSVPRDGRAEVSAGGGDINLQRLLLPWGKLQDDGVYHPALFHMLDVGNVAQALLDEEAAPRFRKVLATALDAGDPSSLSTWLPLLVAVHDIGKLSAPFQGKDGRDRTRRERERLTSQGFNFGRMRGKDYPHQLVSAIFAQYDLPELAADFPDTLLRVVRDALGGHHGVFATVPELSAAADYVKCAEPKEWTALRAAAFRVLGDVFVHNRRDNVCFPSPARTRAATVALAGFTILCDWLGSDASHFPCEPNLTLDQYLPLSRDRARTAVERIDFAPPRPPRRYPGFRALFPTIEVPHPLQVAIDALPESAITWPCLFIIEAPTGEGKTEAALALASRLAASGPSDELYVGLPTTATSNQMFGRVHNFLNRDQERERPVKLIHGQAFLVEDDLLVHLHDDAVADSAVATWFSSRKRALLAPFGVGTVDQVELTALSARHYMLRLFGLAGKVVIIDEVHAYDTYMSTVLEMALQWLAALGSSVILLSATLPTSRHAALARAFLSGTGPDAAESLEAATLPYPCLAAYSPAGTVIASPPAGQGRRDLSVVFVNDESPEKQASRLLRLIDGGGAVCRICNTVDDAQTVFRALEALAPAEVERILIHSRFPVHQRQEIEAGIARRFGPESTRTREESSVVIGTQVLEQSLDLDFDFMVTDHAPTDLLLQRAGRLRRHKRDRPDDREPTVLFVQLPRTADGSPVFGVWRWIYDEYILWTSWLTLEKRQGSDDCAEIALPADYRPLIEATYPSGELTLPAGSPYAQVVHEAYMAYHAEASRASGEARLRLIPDVSSAGGITEAVAVQFEEDTDGGGRGWGSAKTREGAERLTVIPLYRHGDRLSLDRAGNELLGPACDQACQLRLLQNSIPVTISRSRERLAADWRAAREQAPGWFRNDKKAPLLRYTVPLVLDGDTAKYGKLTVTLDPRLGLVFGKEEQ